MSKKFKDIKVKNGTYCFFNDIINIENIDDNIKINEKSYKNVLIYYIGYVTTKRFRICKNL